LDLAQGDPHKALQRILDVIDEYGGELIAGVAERILHGAVRLLVLLDRSDEAIEICARLRRSAEGRAPAEAFALWAEGLVEADAGRAVEMLTETAISFEKIGFVIEQARSLIDLARAKNASGLDGSADLEHARSILETSQARLYLAELEAAEKQVVA
jgi:hypothetical protein